MEGRSKRTAIDYTDELGREAVIATIQQFLSNFEENKHNLLLSRGIYVYGDAGVGKTHLIKKILKDLNYDMVYYDASDVRNKMIIDGLANNNMADTNVLSMFHKKKKKIAIVMDEVDGMNNGDKGGINNLIKLIRPKKTKKQKKEEFTLNPIICVSNSHVDKKIKELKNVCLCVNIARPTTDQIINIINATISTATDSEQLASYVNGDLRKLGNIIDLVNKQIITSETLSSLFEYKSSNDDTKKTTFKLLNASYPMKEHDAVINETDRTSVGLLFHENVVDMLESRDADTYIKLLNNICFADYVDRVTFQKQIWIFNEMTSLIKTFNNSKILHESLPEAKYREKEVRFTKVLTKYATEYNNNKFIQHMCLSLSVDKKDLYLHFLRLRETMEMTKIYDLYEQYDISDLEINRLYKLIDGTHVTSAQIDEDELLFDDGMSDEF
jgi:Cdc6-like AAA superfamily ATPase